MDVSEKLQLKRGSAVFLVNPPKGLDLKVPVSKKDSGAAVLVFALDSKQLATASKPAVDAARQDRLSWIAYPKAGQLGTDLSRDKLFQLMKPFGIEGVRLVSLDRTWSAMRFRPSGHG